MRFFVKEDSGEEMKSDYEKKTDEQLIQSLRDGDDAVMEYLLKKYKFLVRSKASSMFILGGDDQDLVQEGMIGLFKAIKDYDETQEASFYTFADLCISRSVYTAVQKSNRKKHAPLNYYYSLSEEEKNMNGLEAYFGNNQGTARVDSFPETEKNNPEKILLEQEKVNDLMDFIENKLSPLERQVMELCIIGMKSVEIAKILGKSEKSADNALQRAKAKIKTFLEENKIEQYSTIKQSNKS